MAYTLRIKSLIPFKPGEHVVTCNPMPHKICKLMRYMAGQYPQHNITLERDSVVIAYATWSSRRKVHDLGVGPAWQWLQREVHDET